MPDYDIVQAFHEIESELIRSMMGNFKRHRAEETAKGYNWTQWQAEQLKHLNEYIRENQETFPERFDDINEQIDQRLATAAASGEADQEADILKAIRQGYTPPHTPSQGLSGGFFSLNGRKLDALRKATQSDFSRAEYAVLRKANDAYRKIIFNAQVYANTGAGTYEKAVDMAARDFLRAGINSIVYKNGSTHTIEDYADMAIRTASKRAYLMGEGNRRAEWGIRKVVVNSRIGACPRCGQYVGKVFIDDVYSGGSKADGGEPLLSEAIRGGLFHPRCKDSTSTYFEGITTLKPITEEEMEEMDRREKEEARQAYHEREAEKNQRIADNSLDPDNKKTYAHRAEQQRKKAASVKKLQTEESSVIDSWEAENFKNSTESGLLITSDGKVIDFGGTDHHVTGRVDDIRLMDSAVFTHNHPTDSTFSQNDIVTGLVKGNLKELRAVTSTGDIHILVNNGATEEQRKKFSAAYQQRRMKAANAADSKIRKGERINKEEYIRNRLEVFMSENAEDYHLKYVKSHIENNGRPLANSGESGIIQSGALTHKNDPDFKRRKAFAKSYYREILGRKREFEISSVSRNTGFSEEEIDIVFSHIFELDHLFEDGTIHKFFPDYDMAQSWFRLRDGKTIYKHDLILLHHELEEAKIMGKGTNIAYEPVHRKVEEKFNYAHALKKYLKENDLE